MNNDVETCQQCGEIHALESLELTFFRPDAVIELSGDERSRDVRESNDLCVMRNDRHFVRATLPLPVHGDDNPYRLGVWVETSEATFRRIRELWLDDNQAHEPPFDVTLANSIPTVPETRGLTALLRLTGPKTRPEVFIAASTHPMADQQRGGISRHRAFEYTTSVRV